MRCAPAVCVAVIVLGVSAARADILPPGAKSVRLSIHVDAAIPPGKALVLAHTFRGADVLKPGATAPVEWHPLGGPMQLVVIDAGDVRALEAARAALERDPIEKITARGLPCGAPFSGVRTVPDTSSTSEIRWTYRVGLANGTCTAALLRTERLDDHGKLVGEGPDDAPGAPGAPPAPVEEPAASAAPSPAPSPSSVPPPSRGCGACAVGGEGPLGAAWAWCLGAAAIGGARARRARRARRVDRVVR
jgi:hypothetical protein